MSLRALRKDADLASAQAISGLFEPRLIAKPPAPNTHTRTR